MRNKTTNVIYVVTLKSNCTPFSDDARYDASEQVFSEERFSDEKNAKKYVKSKVKELGLFGRGNLFSNGQYELFVCPKQANRV